MTRTTISVILLGIAALGGVVLATLRLRQKPIPLVVALLHGVLAASGIITLLSFVLDLVSVAGSTAIVGFMPLALALFVGAAIGGLVLFSYHVRGELLPRKLMYVHAFVALLAYACLLVGVVTGK